MSIRLLTGDCRELLKTLPDSSVHACITSPPYYALRSYLHADHPDKHRELGSEPTPEAYLAAMVGVFREIKRILRDDGCVFLNMGDSYGGSTTNTNSGFNARWGNGEGAKKQEGGRPETARGGKPKDLMMMPARLALALQADGWWLRSMLPWLKRSAMPESVTDRPATAIEYVFLLTRSARYFWDGEAVKRGLSPGPRGSFAHGPKTTDEDDGRKGNSSFRAAIAGHVTSRNMRNSDLFYDSLGINTAPSEATRRSYAAGYDGQSTKGHDAAGVQNASDVKRRTLAAIQARMGAAAPAPLPLFDGNGSEPLGLICDADGEPLALDVNPQAFSGAHFAVFPERLVEPLIRAGTSERGCCAACGAPWRRITEKAYRNPGNRTTNGPRSLEQRHETAGFAVRLEADTTTTGWSASCQCNADVVPCVVLDPFGGSGTTGLVADRLQRDAILIELNPAYGDMATTRVVDDAPLLAWLDAAQ